MYKTILVMLTIFAVNMAPAAASNDSVRIDNAADQTIDQVIEVGIKGITDEIPGSLWK
jgi:hypothetical protein